ncbi:MAG: hypothetical protein ACP5IB_07110 [Thermoplasmata archaeon]
MNFENLNKLYDSNNKEDLLQFWQSFKNFNEIISFIRNRPEPSISLHFKNADALKDIIFVVPVPDMNNYVEKYIQNFKNYFIIFVESRGPYFNFSKSMNKGIEEALKFNPNWIALSNLDITPLDDTSILREILYKQSPGIFIPRIISENKKVIDKICIIPYGILINYIFKNLQFISKKLPLYYQGNFFISSLKINDIDKIFKYITINKYYKINKNFSFNLKDIYLKLKIKKSICFKNIQPLSFIHSSIIRKYRFDEDFINGGEDTELSIRMVKNGEIFKDLDLYFKTKSGAFLRNNEVRFLKNSILEKLLLGIKLKKY